MIYVSACLVLSVILCLFDVQLCCVFVFGLLSVMCLLFSCFARLAFGCRVFSSSDPLRSYISLELLKLVHFDLAYHDIVQELHCSEVIVPWLAPVIRRTPYAALIQDAVSRSGAIVWNCRVDSRTNNPPSVLVLVPLLV